jgi:hypothetical protein
MLIYWNGQAIVVAQNYTTSVFGDSTNEFDGRVPWFPNASPGSWCAGRQKTEWESNEDMKVQ